MREIRLQCQDLFLLAKDQVLEYVQKIARESHSRYFEWDMLNGSGGFIGTMNRVEEQKPIPSIEKGGKPTPVFRVVRILFWKVRRTGQMEGCGWNSRQFQEFTPNALETEDVHRESSPSGEALILRVPS